MFDWLFEGRREIYCLLAVLAVGLLLVWWRNRQRYFLLAAAAVLALAGVYYVLDQFVETAREQIVRKLHEMTDAVKARDAEGVFKHIARDFRFRHLDRAGFRNTVGKVLSGGMLEEVVIYDEEWPDGGDEHTLPVRFRAKPKGGALGDQAAYPVVAQFVREADGEWRMQGFEVYNPVLSKEPMTIPLLP